MEFIDTHTHPYLLTASLDRSIAHSKENNVTKWIGVAINIETTKTLLNLNKSYPIIEPTIGIHPCEVHKHNKLHQLNQLLTDNSFVAIGEIGLDYHWHPEEETKQKDYLYQQLELAKTFNLPVIIHNRKADADIIQITNEYPKVPLVFHCFCSNEKFIEQTLTAYRYYSFTGLITYSKKGKTVRALKELPLSHIMLETDCPYLVPKSKKHYENEPANIPEIAHHIAELKQIDIETVARSTTKTARQFFNLNE